MAQRPTLAWRAAVEEDADRLADGTLDPEEAVMAQLYPDDMLRDTDQVLDTFEEGLRALVDPDDRQVFELLEQVVRALNVVLAVSRSHLVPLDGGKTRVRADRVAADLPDSAWQRRSAGAGSKGPRYYDWAWLDEVTTDADPDDDGHHSLLIRRNTTTGELAFCRCWTPKPTTLAQLVRVAGIRWTVEEAFQAAKSQVGLDQHQVHRWHSWHRFTTLALAALAVLAICAADAGTDDTDGPTGSGLIRLTVNEIRRLINACIIRPISDLAHGLRLSHWRRRHQARARQSHYTRRLNLDPSHDPEQRLPY